LDYVAIQQSRFTTDVMCQIFPTLACSCETMKNPYHLGSLIGTFLLSVKPSIFYWFYCYLSRLKRQHKGAQSVGFSHFSEAKAFHKISI